MIRTTLTRAAGLLALGALVLRAAAAFSAGSAACDRECLHDVMDHYLAALVAHQPQMLKTTADVKFTENTNRMKLGDGLWQTIGALGTFRLYVEDPHSGQVAFYGTVKENGVTALLGVRLKQRAKRLSEIETYVVRQATGVHGSFDNLTTVPAEWTQTVPPAERSTPEQLRHDANQYFNGIEQGNGSIVPFAADCLRTENGAQTAPTVPTATRPSMSAGAQFDTHMFDYIHEITNRRFLLTDPQRGLVYAVVMFQHPGNIKPQLNAVTATASGTAPRTFSLSSYPNTTQIIETFQVRGGKIQRIFAYVSLLPYRQAPGW
ncbi:MAG TPA: hypothetical protein VHW25_04630 [Steroidobacteraceae bacterium]|jgi:hypothetical protein|nr:hypothetical protein [Steroidobacteraceae bacterium]